MPKLIIEKMPEKIIVKNKPITVLQQNGLDEPNASGLLIEEEINTSPLKKAASMTFNEHYMTEENDIIEVKSPKRVSLKPQLLSIEIPNMKRNSANTAVT